MTADARRAFSVLIVDDDVDIRETIADVCLDAGYSTLTAGNGAEALKALEVEHPDVILLDLNMPIMGGAEFREAQRRVPHWASIPTILLTAIDRASERARLLGIEEVIAKPVKLPLLLAALSRAIARRGAT